MMVHGICPLMQVGNEFNIFTTLQKLSHDERMARCGRCRVRMRRADGDRARARLGSAHEFPKPSHSSIQHHHQTPQSRPDT